MNIYGRLQDVKAAIQGLQGTGSDAVLLRLMEEISREIEGFTHVSFAAVTATRTFPGNGKRVLRLPPENGFLAALTTLAVDPYGQHVYTLSPVIETDYYTLPENTDGVDPKPIMWLEINPRSSLISVWPCDRKAVRITGRFGWSEETESTGVTIAEDLDATETGITAATKGIYAGDTILIGSEQLYVESVGGTGLELTVVRGVNGTTAATHTTSAAVLRRRYPRPIEQVVLARTIQRFKRQEVGYVSTIANSEIGTFNLYRGTDADFDRALSIYSFPEVA